MNARTSMKREWRRRTFFSPRGIHIAHTDSHFVAFSREESPREMIERRLKLCFVRSPVDTSSSSLMQKTTDDIKGEREVVMMMMMMRLSLSLSFSVRLQHLLTSSVHPHASNASRSILLVFFDSLTRILTELSISNTRRSPFPAPPALSSLTAIALSSTLP